MLLSPVFLGGNPINRVTNAMGAALKHIAEFETDVWLLDHRSPALLTPNDLSSDERTYYDSLNLPSLKERFLSSRALLRSVLGKFCESEPNPWNFTRDERGRWRWENPREVFFSLSHCQHTTAIAASTKGEIGVDIESRKRIPESSFLESAFTANENRAFITEPDPERALQAWTAKEAYTKLTGQGPELDPQTFEVHWNPLSIRPTASTERVAVRLESKTLHFNEDDFVLTIASRALDSEAQHV